MFETVARGVGMAIVAIGLAWPGSAGAQEGVTRALLDALRENGQLRADQHEELVGLLEEQGAGSGANDLRVFWKDGLRMETADGDFALRLGGRIQHDWAFADGSDGLEDRGVVGDDASGTEFRRVRLYVAGTLYERFKFKAQYDFAGGDAEVKDMFVEATEVPWVGNIRLGHFKEPFSLEQLTSAKYLTFQERSVADVFTPGRNAGVMVYDDLLESRITWALGAFRETDDFGMGFGEDSTYNVTARVTGTPWMRDEAHLLHLGLSYSHKFRKDDGVRFRQRPEAHLLGRIVDTGTLVVDDLDLVNPEVAAVVGPWSLQAEYMRAFTDTGGDNPDLGGFYVQTSYFLTGEHRVYDPSSGVFKRVRPTRNVDLKGGLGAWEVAVRYSHLDLDDEGVRGGEVDGLTAGLNWYLAPNLRTILNYVHSDRDDGGNADIVEARFQVDF